MPAIDRSNDDCRYGLSILNEDEHGIRPEGGVAYTT